jgi:hypothetical protein
VPGVAGLALAHQRVPDRGIPREIVTVFCATIHSTRRVMPELQSAFFRRDDVLVIRNHVPSVGRSGLRARDMKQSLSKN